jgi:hypothetical protein
LANRPPKCNALPNIGNTREKVLLALFGRFVLTLTTMTPEEVSTTIQSILTQHFNIPASQFSWEKPLEVLQKDFKILGYLVFLEQLLHQHFGKKIPLLENISTTFHTPRDLVQLVLSEL